MKDAVETTTTWLLAVLVMGASGACYTGIDGADPSAAADTDGEGTDDGEGNDGGDDGSGDGGPEAQCGTAPSVVRMLNRREYRNTLRDLLGLDQGEADALAEAIPADARVGFDNNAQSLVASAIHVEQHLAIAETVAETVDLDGLLQCDGDDPGDEQICAEAFVDEFGERAFRRPLEDEERARMLALFVDARDDGRSFADAIRLVLQALLQAPQFLYRIETSAHEDGGEVRVDDYALASRLSYFVWGSMPDDALFEAAALGDEAVLEEHARRMLQDPRARRITAAFHRQWFELDALDGSDALQAAFAAETEAFAEYVFWESSGRAEQLLISDEILLDETVAAHYDVPGSFSALPSVVAATEQRFGLLTQGGILSHTSNPDRTSPTKRGRFVRQQLLCEQPPPPPQGVPELPEVGPEGQSLRERLDQHTSDPICAACHELLDPIGFGLENYDHVGRFRTEDGGVAIDASGELVGVSGLEQTEFVGARQLAERLVESGELQACTARQWFRFAMGREARPEDACALEILEELLASSDGTMSELVVAIATSAPFVHLATESSQ